MLSEAGIKWLINLALVAGVFLLVVLVGIQYTLNQILHILREIRRNQVWEESQRFKKEN